jgi:ribosomal protein L16
MLQPKRTKYRKAHKGRIHGAAKGGARLNFGSYGLKALEPERITARQIEAARRAITRHMKRAGRVWVLLFGRARARVHPNFGPAGSTPVGSCLKLTVSTRRPPGVQWTWLRRNCRSAPSS